MSKRNYKDPDEIMLRRTNKFIESYNSNTLVENKILAYAEAVAKPRGSRMIAEFRIADLKGYQGISAPVLYRKAKEMREVAIKKSYTISNTKEDDPNSFISFNLVDTYKYEDGIVTVLFTEGATNYVFNTNETFTTEEVKQLFKFKKNSTYRLYELLSTKRYLLNNCYSTKKKFELADLKMQMGLLKFSEDEKDSLKKKLKHVPSAKELLEAYPEREPYHNWSSFAKKVLLPATKELSLQQSVFNVDFEPIRSRRGGRVYGVIFTIYRDDCVVSESDLDTTNSGNFIEASNSNSPELQLKVMQLMKDEPITLKDVNSLLAASKNDISKIESAYNQAKQQEAINNLIAWMIAAIKHEYTEPIPSMKGMPAVLAKREQQSNDTLNAAIHTFHDVEAVSKLLKALKLSFLNLNNAYTYDFDTLDPNTQIELMDCLVEFISEIKGAPADPKLIEVALGNLLNWNIKLFFGLLKQIVGNSTAKFPDIEATLLAEAASVS